jgi:hypothetical protein
MVASNTVLQESKAKQVAGLGYIPVSGNAVEITNIVYDEYSDTVTNTVTNGGFTPTNP